MRERTLVINALRLDGNGENPTALVLPTGGDAPFTTVPAVPSGMAFPLNGRGPVALCLRAQPDLARPEDIGLPATHPVTYVLTLLAGIPQSSAPTHKPSAPTHKPMEQP